MRRGFDVSFYQGEINFQQMKAWGADFVILKAGQGNWSDPRFVENLQKAKAAGIPYAIYWYFDQRYDPKEQARKLADIIRDEPNVMCWLDLEDERAGALAWRSWYDFIVEFQSLCDNPIGIYTGFYYFTEHTTSATTPQKLWFKQFPLWEAWYFPSDPFNPIHVAVLVPFPWTEEGYKILQSGTPAIGHATGVQSLEIDYNILMDDSNLRTYFKLTDSLPDDGEQEGHSMLKGKVIKLTNIREFRTQYSKDLGDLLAGDVVEWEVEWAGTDGLTWIQLISATRNGSPVKCTDGLSVAGRYCWANNVEEIPTPEPQPDERPTTMTLGYPSGRVDKFNLTYLPE